MIDSWHSYPSTFALGHKALAELLLDPVLVEEKIDGSQFSWCVVGGEFRARWPERTTALDSADDLVRKSEREDI